MIFFSQKIKFKKQSQSTALNLNDKRIKRNKEQLLMLTKKHEEVDEKLKKQQVLFDMQKAKLLAEHQLLLEQQKQRKEKILKLEIRKDQLLSKSNPTITQNKAKTLKKYLKSMIYTIGDRYGIIKYLKNLSTYDFIKTKVLNLQHRLYLKSKMREIVFMKKLQFQGELLMLLIKQKDTYETQKSMKQPQPSSHKIRTVKSIHPSKFNPSTDQFIKSNKSYEVNIYALTGKSFNYCKVYSEKQLIFFIESLMNRKITVQMGYRPASGNNQLTRSKPRISLQFNPVFKKSLQGFFFKRSSLTTSQIHNKSINIDSQDKESNQISRSRRDSDSSINEMLQTSQDASSQMNSMLQSKKTYNQSQFLSSHQTQLKNQSQKMQGTSENDNTAFVQSQQINELSQEFVKNTDKQVLSNNYQGSNENSCIDKTGEEPFSGFIRSFLYGQKALFPDSNPLLNIVILKKENTFQFLPEYLEKKQKFDLVMLCVKKYQLKIKLQKQVRKSLLYKIVKIQKFFETENQELQPFSLDVFFSVKYAKNDIYIPKISEIPEYLKHGKKFYRHDKLEGKQKDAFDGIPKGIKTFNGGDIVITCQNIRCEREDKTFFINHLLRQEVASDLNNRVFNMISNTGTSNNRTKGRIQNSQTKKKQGYKEDKSKEDRKRIRKRKNSKDKVQNNQELKQEDERKDQIFRSEIQNMFESFIEGNLLSIKEYRFLRKIDYPSHLNKIIIIQKNLKCFYYRKLYKKKKLFPLVWKFEPYTKIFISAILDSEKHEIKIFTECLVLKLNSKYKSYPLIFPQKYWSTIGTALGNLTRLSESIVEVKDELEKYLGKRIMSYEKEQARLEALKPQLQLNRLRRFFINISLRVRVKKNILFLKKLFVNSQAYLLIIRKSQILRTVCQANLYHLVDLQQKQPVKRNTPEILEDDNRDVLGVQFRTGKSLNLEERRKVKYQTINLLVEYFSGISKQKIPEQFYFDNEHFLLKPPRSSSTFYIQRLLMVDINSQEIAKQVAMIEWQDPNKRKRPQQHHENGSLLNLQQKSSQQSSMTLKQQTHNSKNNIMMTLGALKPQQSKLKLKRVNPSIIIDNETQKKQLPIQSGKKELKQRKQFRIAARPKRVLLREEHGNRPRGSSNVNNNNNEQQQQQQLLLVSKQEVNNQESRSKLMSNSRLSRSSLYDIFNTSSNKKSQYVIKGNGHGRYIYYSLAKVEEVFFELQLYIVKRTFVLKNNQKKQHQSGENKQHQPQIENQNNKPTGGGQNKLTLGQRINYQWQQHSVADQSSQFVKHHAFSDQLILVHRQHITKKQLLQANWIFFYHRIAEWIKRNQHLLVVVDEVSKQQLL